MKISILITKRIFILSLLIVIAQGCNTRNSNAVAIYIKQNANEKVVLAAREIKKYIYQRSGELLPIKELKSNSVIKGDAIIVESSSDLIKVDGYTVPKLHPHGYILKTLTFTEGKRLLVCGGSPLGTLYAAYHFAEQLGIGFYLNGDVIPDKQIPFDLPDLDIKQKPLFSIRGILPFHDFPEGPDWWSVNDYKAIIAQLPKLGMNFTAFHTYPEGVVGPEPMVWIGPSWAIGSHGRVQSSYASSHFTTLKGVLGIEPMNTSSYSFGASQMYGKDNYGAKYMMEAGSPRPKDFVKQNELFDTFGKLLADAFTFAKELGVKTCIGTETPLKIPTLVKNRLTSLGKDPSNPKVVQKVYEGIFQRIKDTHPLDYYWLWTPENWTWKDVKKAQIEETVSDLKSAVDAVKAVNAPFTLATSGWVLGPPQDRSLFDNLLPKKMPMSTINRYVGWAPVEPGFTNVENRPKWAIPWLEDDLGMIIPQLWAGRMRRDAADALAYGNTGLIGIHWRTRIIGPNVSALAHAAWSQKGWNPDYPNQGNFSNSKPSLEPYKSGDKSRDLPVLDFYINWAKIHFGDNVSNEIGNIFSRLDGSKFNPKKRKANLPRPAKWLDGPGGITPDKRPWDSVRKEYLFVDTLENIRSRIKGPGNMERFDYWLHQFKYLRAMGHLNCVWYQFNKAMEKIQTSNDSEKQKALALKEALPLRIKMIDILTKVQNNLMESITTYGGLGNVTNWQQHNMPGLIREPGLQLKKYLGAELPQNAKFPTQYSGNPHMFIPTVRTVLDKGEALDLKVITIAPENSKPVKETIYWRTPGEKRFNSGKLRHLARGVYTFRLDPEEISDKGLEYYIQINFNNGDVKRFPATAPHINQVVTIMP